MHAILCENAECLTHTYGSLKPCLWSVFHFHGARPERWLVLHRTLGSEDDGTTLCFAYHHEPLQEQCSNGAGFLWCSKLNTVCKSCEVHQCCYDFGRGHAVSLLLLCFHLVPPLLFLGIPSRFMVTTPHQRCWRAWPSTQPCDRTVLYPPHQRRSRVSPAPPLSCE